MGWARHPLKQKQGDWAWFNQGETSQELYRAKWFLVNFFRLLQASFCSVPLAGLSPS